MKKLLYLLPLFFGVVACGAQVQATPNIANTVNATSTSVPTPIGGPTIEPILAEEHDPYGELYFTIITPNFTIITPTEEDDPSIEIDQNTLRLARLPGSCVVGLIECPEVQIVQTPFNVKDIWSDGTGIAWSPDGRYGLLITHPEDELSGRKDEEELDKMEHRSLSEFNISPSRLYLFDAQIDTWSEVNRMERKFTFNPKWSPDGQWIAFAANSSPWPFHAPQSDDGIYVIHADGSGLKQLSGMSTSTYVLGWVGNSILLQRAQGLFSTVDSVKYRMEMLTLDGETKLLFETDRMANYTLSPDGNVLLAADIQGDPIGSPASAVDVLALDGSIMHTFGTFTNYTSGVYPVVWSHDGSMVAFENMRRAYVGLRDGQGGGFPMREVYLADGAYAPSLFPNFQFSSDDKYLLMDVYEGVPHFVVVALETGQSTILAMKGVTNLEQAQSISWRP